MLVYCTIKYGNSGRIDLLKIEYFVALVIEKCLIVFTNSVLLPALNQVCDTQTIQIVFQF